uniref:Six-hairpin glycosidase n=1 Tax=Haemonchus contortus TaxID=6289 RepID=A0A7I4XXQ4_HAECO
FQIMGINHRDNLETCQIPCRTSINRCATLIVDRPNQLSGRQLAIHSNRIAERTTDPHGRLWSTSIERELSSRGRNVAANEG